ncbi:OsmC family protein [Ornithinibacillus halophilus]|uniref:Uncharacterized OsmC-related protein n=1 Tax=Ornithinibacillus halophilus TaxID=930117 RepID=A0A1M5NV72_9BACI|nr:OsmC family protein [Ornithinibacillus halophilus]SHG93412.1 Uncharacterized OsmC-related protein [Ornithinibacillus halophilus]
MIFKMKEKGFQAELEYDVLNVSADENFGFRPYQLLISSIVGCSGGVFRKILEKKRLAYEDITISANVKRNPEIANRIEEIHLVYTIIAEDLEPSKIEKALELTRKNCAMIQSVQDSIVITEEFEIKQSK